MARLPRICSAGIAQHVIQRGNNRQICFGGDDRWKRGRYSLTPEIHPEAGEARRTSAAVPPARATKKPEGKWVASPLSPHEAIRTVLSKLGIDNQNWYLHESHFHINLRTPDIKPLTPPQNLLANDAIVDQTQTVANSDLTAAAQALLAEVRIPAQAGT